MYTELANRLVLTAPGTPYVATSVTQPIDVTGANATQFSVVCYVMSATNVVITLQESNDLENWTDRSGVGSGVTVTGVGYSLSSSTGATVATRYVRAKLVLTGTAAGQTAVIAVGINSSLQ